MSISEDEVPYEDPDHPLGDWIYEVVNHNTYLLTNNIVVTEEKK